MPFKTPDDNRAWERRRYRRLTAERTSQGRCPKCGHRPPAPDRRLCEVCGEQRRAADRARYARAKAEGKLYAGRDAEARRRAARIGTKRRYHARRAAGLCTKCGKHPPVAGSHTTCEYCRNRRNANERDSWSARRADGLCGKCGASVDHGTARCAGCAAIQARSVSPERKNAATRKRYARRRARRLCVDCQAPSHGAARCPECAWHSYARSAEHRGLPVSTPQHTVIVVATGRQLGTFENEAEVAACLAFSRLSADDVEIVIDTAVMASLSAWE